MGFCWGGVGELIYMALPRWYNLEKMWWLGDGHEPGGVRSPRGDCRLLQGEWNLPVIAL